MKIDEILSIFYGKVNSTIRTDEDIIAEPKAIQFINQARAFVAADKMKNSMGRIHPDWVQTEYPVYDERLQNNPECTLFRSIPFLSLGQTQHAITFIGASDCQTAYRIKTTRNELANLKKHPVLTYLNGRHLYCLYMNGIWEIYGKAFVRVKDLRIDAMFSDPFQVSTWNPDTDQYPVDKNSVNDVIEMAYKLYLEKPIMFPANQVSNSSDDKKLANK